MCCFDNMLGGGALELSSFCRLFIEKCLDQTSVRGICACAATQKHPSPLGFLEVALQLKAPSTDSLSDWSLEARPVDLKSHPRPTFSVLAEGRCSAPKCSEVVLSTPMFDCREGVWVMLTSLPPTKVGRVQKRKILVWSNPPPPFSCFYK